jgi:uncharacterized protein HemY
MQEHRGDEKEIVRLRAEEADLMDRDSTLAPDNADIFYHLGLLRYTLGEWEKADVAFHAACEKAPRNYDYRMALALLQEKRYDETADENQFEMAAQSLKVLHDMNPSDPRAEQILIRLRDTRNAKEAAKTGPPKT